MFLSAQASSSPVDAIATESGDLNRDKILEHQLSFSSGDFLLPRSLFIGRSLVNGISISDIVVYCAGCFA